MSHDSPNTRSTDIQESREPAFGSFRMKRSASKGAALDRFRHSSAHAQLLRTLLHKLEERRQLKGPLDQAVELEVAALIHLVSRLTPAELTRQRPFLEFAVALLESPNPEINVIHGIRIQLELLEQRAGKGMSGFIVRLSGPIPESTVFAAIATLAFILIAVFLLFVIGYPHLTKVGGDITNLYVAAESRDALPVVDLLVIISAAFIGSIASMLLSVGRLSRITYQPLLLYFTTLSKPFIAILFCLFIYGVLQSKLVSFFGVNIGESGGLYLLWVVGFLCGFSERFVDRFISGAESRFSGNRDDNVHPPSTIPTP